MWFRRDLRLRDHPALVAASASSDVVGLFVLDPILWHKAGLPAQADLLRLIASGLSNEEIAEREGVGVKAVERRIARLYQTLHVPTSVGTNPRVEATLMYNKAQVVVR
jgi:deoxyribodipyrimidine photo-lyase